MKSQSFSLIPRLTLAAWILAGFAPAGHAQVKIDGSNKGPTYSITSGTQTSSSYTRIGDTDFTSPTAGSGLLFIQTRGKFVTNGSLDVSFGGVYVDGPASSLVSNGYVGIGNNTSVWGGLINLNHGALFHAASTTANLDIGSQSGAFGSLYVETGSLLMADGNVVVGAQSGSTGWLQVDLAGQATLAQRLTVGWQGTGTVLVNGPGSKLTASGYTSIGDMGTGNLTLSNSANFSAGDIVVLGHEATGSGTMLINSGSTVSVAKGIQLGWQGTGAVTVDGPGSKLSAAGYSSIGDSGTGSLTLTNAANFTAGDTVVLGLNATALGAVVVNSGSTVSTAKDMQVGWQGTGTLSVDGAGSTLQVVNGGLFAGWQGSGTINVTNGGTLNTNGWASLADQAGSHGAMTVDGASSQFNLSGGMTVGNQGSGTLDITHGGTVNTTGWGTQIGAAAGSSGAVTVDGAGSTWTNSGDLLLGWAGIGSLAVSNGGALSTHVLTVGGDFSSGIGHGTLALSSGGTVNNFDGLIGNSSGSSGAVTVDGAGSAWHISSDLEVGLSGSGANGTLAITNGGAVTAGWYMGVGINGNSGAITVDGTGSSLSLLGGMDLGGGGPGGPGTGTLAITHGGSVSTNYSNIGGSDGSVGAVSVEGTGSTWTASGDLLVGASGNGSLTITNGGVVTSASALGFTTSIGSQAGSIGEVSVDGPGSAWTIADQLLVGNAGTGSLAITHGGTVTATSVNVAANAGSNGTVTVDGGTLNAPALTIGTGGTLNFNSSSLSAGTINSSTITNSGQFTINTRDPLAGSADVRALGATVANLASGRIDVNLANEASVTFTGPVTNDGQFKVTQLAGTGGGVTAFTDTFTNNGTFISDPTTTHFAALFNFGQFTAGPGDTIITDHGFVNNGMVDIFGGADFYGDYSGPGSLQFHISSATDRLYFNAGFTGSLELIFDPSYLLTGTEDFLSFGQGAYLTDLLIGGVDYGSASFSGAGFLTGSGTFVPASSVPDTTAPLGLLAASLLILAAVRRRVA